MSKSLKRKLERDQDETSEEDVSFEKNDGKVKGKQPEIEENGRSKRQKRKVTTRRLEEMDDEYDDEIGELADDYENLSDLDIPPTINLKTNFDAGQILEIEMKDFMCHRRFTVKLGRRLNFVVGKNGSGKSAIATALQLCLGATARNTGRGTALSTFIREGSNGPASVRVTLVNEGADAYCPDRYGKRITVERRITKGTGSSGYHILDENKREVSSGKDELEKILRCFNIYVDNPCCVLTQEESKKFVFGRDTDKYDFFLKATGLYNLRDDLIKIKSELEETAKVKEIEENKLETKRQAAAELYEKIKEMEKLEEMEQEIRISMAKIHWDDYRQEYEKLTIKQQEMKKLLREQQRAERDLDAASKNQDLQEDEIQDLAKKVTELEQEQQGLSQTLEQRNADYRQASSVLHQLTTVQNNHTTQQRDEQRRIKEIEREIKEKRDKMKQTANADARVKAERVEEINHKIESLRQEERELKQASQRTSELLASMNQEKTSAKFAMENAQRGLQQAQDMINGLSSSNHNRAAMIADYMPRLLQGMSQRSFQQPVMGPIGAKVTIKEGYTDWGRAIERALGPFLRSFVTTNMDDTRTISQLQKQFDRAQSVPVYTQHRGPRYEIDHMPSGVICLADILNIPDDMIFNCLVDQLNIDRIILVKDEQEIIRKYVEQREGRDVLRFDAVSAITADGTLVRYIQGNQASEVCRFPFRNILSGDITAMLTAQKKLIQQKEVELTDATTHYQTRSQQISETLKELTKTRQQIEAVNKEIIAQQRQKERLEDELQEIDAINQMDLSPLELERDDRRSVVEQLSRNLEQIGVEISQAKDELQRMKKAKEVVDHKKAAILQELKQIEEKMDQILTNRESMRRKLDVLKRRCDEQTAIIQQQQQQIHVLEAELQQQKQQAIARTIELLGEPESELWGFSPEELSPLETKAYLEKKIKTLKAEIIATKREIGLKGYTMAILQERYQRAQSEYELLLETMERLQHHFNLLQQDAQTRQEKWLRALKESTDITKRKFDYYVQEKGSSGTIKFHHKEKRLEITYQVDNNDRESKANDIRNLSGGERSFVTFSVLLALGHVIECPFRLMDEYDVFLDNISRRLTLDQLQRYVKRADQSNRQFIIITPHDVSAVKTNSQVKIIQMPEPQRLSAHGLQQQTLD